MQKKHWLGLPRFPEQQHPHGADTPPGIRRCMRRAPLNDGMATQWPPQLLQAKEYPPHLPLEATGENGPSETKMSQL